ncbi:hypothetical protein H5407_10690 [Mitsuaria sp. WAJ17]|uniref:hypothetical protein n=1 Tax=Mitsuaria sp. WAJ17 TaxID=2761452 RepID=UPI001601BE04|nr:hypothetical protein [Mitsuaria sp. WAJ17]MBB2485685.1 hypothetical protein [Mitsuaria sp. WAJ17]
MNLMQALSAHSRAARRPSPSIACAALAAAAAALCHGPAMAQTAPAAASAMPAACSLPMKPAATQEETAWQLFVAAHCTVNTPGGQKLNWETWTEQTCWLNPGAPGCKTGEQRKRFSHAMSLLATRGKLHAPAASTAATGLPGCQPMTAKSSQTPKSLLPFVPGNLSANPQFCEEVYVNASEAAFVTSPPGGKPGGHADHAHRAGRLHRHDGQAAGLSQGSGGDQG